jgi:hypothetical protein
MHETFSAAHGGAMEIDHARLDDLRAGRGEIQEHVIDEFVAGRLVKRALLVLT